MPFRFKARTSLTSQSASCESVSALTTRTHSPQPASVRRFLPSRRVLCAISTFAAWAGQLLEPGVLQRIGILKLIDQHMFEARLIMRSHLRIARKQFITAQQQFGEIHHALALALSVIGRVQLRALL